MFHTLPIGLSSCARHFLWGLWLVKISPTSDFVRQLSTYPLDTQSRLPAADVRHPDRDGREHKVLNARGHTVPVRCGRKVPRHSGAFYRQPVKRTRMPVKTGLIIQNTCYLECLDTQCRSPACRFQCVQ